MERSTVVGIFGAGHLGQTISHGLLKAGVDKSNIILCHGGSPDTSKRLRKANLSDLVVSTKELCSRSNILLYIVRPKDFMAIEKYSVKMDCLFISFLGGVSLSQLPISLPKAQRVRIMPSAPDTIRTGKGVAATYPSGNDHVKELLSMLSLREVPLKQESDIHASTGLGLCLPIALTYWDSLGNNFDEMGYIEMAEKHRLPNPSGMVSWARSVQMRDLTGEELQAFLKQAATPGGVTEAVLNGISEGTPLHMALELGLLRSKSLAEG